MREGFSGFLLEFVVGEKGVGIPDLGVDEVVEEMVHLFLEGNKEPFDGDSEGGELLLIFEEDDSELELFVGGDEFRDFVIDVFEDFDLGDISFPVGESGREEFGFEGMDGLFESVDFDGLL